MSPLGLFITTLGALGGPGLMGDPGGAAGPVKDDLLWECDGSGNLTPIAFGLLPGADNNDIWDYTSSPYEYTPEADATNEDEGFWEIDGNDDIQPIVSAASICA